MSNSKIGFLTLTLSRTGLLLFVKGDKGGFQIPLSPPPAKVLYGGQALFQRGRKRKRGKSPLSRPF
jgi:hypothetical protein